MEAVRHAYGVEDVIPVFSGLPTWPNDSVNMTVTGKEYPTLADLNGPAAFHGIFWARYGCGAIAI